MNIRVLALSAALLFSTSVFAQTNAPTTAPDNGTTTTQSTNNPNGMNNGNMANNPNGMNDRPVGTVYGRTGGGGAWGWWGLLGLFGFFGLARGGRRRDDVVRTNNLPPR